MIYFEGPHIDIRCIWVKYPRLFTEQSYAKKERNSGLSNLGSGASFNLTCLARHKTKKRSLLHALDHLELRCTVPVSL